MCFTIIQCIYTHIKGYQDILVSSNHPSPVPGLAMTLTCNSCAQNLQSISQTGQEKKKNTKTNNQKKNPNMLAVREPHFGDSVMATQTDKYITTHTPSQYARRIHLIFIHN